MNNIPSASTAKSQTYTFLEKARAVASKHFEKNIEVEIDNKSKRGLCSVDIPYLEQHAFPYSGISESDVHAKVTLLQTKGYDVKSESNSCGSATLKVSWCTLNDWTSKSSPH